MKLSRFDLSLAQKEMAQEAFMRVEPSLDTLGILFYARLFELDPSLQALFKTDLDEQAHALVTMLRLSIEGLDDEAELIPTLKSLGARHVEYGVKPRDYDTVNLALLWTMEQGLGPDWNPEIANALDGLFKLFTDVMQGREM